MAHVLLAVAQLLGLLLIFQGAPGVWLQLIALAGFGWWTGFTAVNVVPLLVLFALVVAAELLGLLLARGPADSGVGRRTSIGAVLGATIGAAAGLVIPLVGSMVGALSGAMAGAFAAGARPRSPRSGPRPEFAGPAAAAALRATAGIAIASFTLFVLIP